MAYEIRHLLTGAQEQADYFDRVARGEWRPPMDQSTDFS
jgi:hypothetical protein